MKKRNNKEVSNLSCKSKVNPMSEKIQFEESLEDDDWGIIIGKDGTLKGMFIPEGKDEEEIYLGRNMPNPELYQMLKRIFEES